MITKITNFFNRSKSEPIGPTKLNVGMSAGTLVNDEVAMMSSAYHRGLIYLSSQLAKLPLQIKNKNNEQIEDDVWYLLNVQPNPESTAMFLKMFLIQCAINHGEGYAEIVKTVDGRPKELWPLNPKRVRAARDTEGNLVYEVFRGGSNGETVYLRPSEILIIKNLHTKDGVQALGTIAYALDSLGIAIGADRFANSLYANGGLPSGILTHPGTLSEVASKRLLESWKNSQGGRKTGSTALLEEGVTYSPISHSPDLLQFIETRKFSVVDIARFLGVPPIKLFDMDSAKYGNMEQVQLEVATDILDSWARNIESEIDIKLLKGRRAGKRAELDLYATFRGDMNTRSQYFNRMMQSSAITPNEIREKEGLAPYKEGDRFYIANNNYAPVDRLDEIIDSQVAPKEVVKEPIDPASEAVAKYLEHKIKN